MFTNQLQVNFDVMFCICDVGCFTWLFAMCKMINTKQNLLAAIPDAIEIVFFFQISISEYVTKRGHFL